MRKNILLAVSAIFLIVSTKGQNPSVELTFTAVNDITYVQTDSIKVMNRTQGGDTVLYWPDTLLLLDFQVGTPEINTVNDKFRVLQNYPNPVEDQATITLFVPESDNVIIKVTDMLGRTLLESARVLGKGIHSFRFSPGQGNLFLFSAQWRGVNSAIKILHAGSNTDTKCSLEYEGVKELSAQYKAAENIQGFGFNPGDELLFIGYADGFQSGIPDAPQASRSYSFQFATNIPCPGIPEVEYEGQVYNTIQIYSQCWLIENLNVGTMIPGTGDMTDNGFIEKYCYDNDPYMCLLYGGLYQWDEMMQYATGQGIQGICPPGWNLPTDEDWKVLEGAADSQYGIGDNTWDDVGYRGYDVGTNLKATSGWYENGNGTDLFSFSGMPGGFRDVYGSFFFSIGSEGLWWSSTEKEAGAWNRSLHYDSPGVSRNEFDSYTDMGRSVRCVRKEPFDPYKLLTGEESKTWKLFREGICMSVGPNPDDPAGWWEGLENNGERPCLYQQEITFYFDGTYEFNDNGYFWGEYGVFNGQWNYEICFEALPENMINLNGDDVSAWLSGTHAFTYDPSSEDLNLTLNGLGAWIGIPKLATAGETVVPVSSVSCNISITEQTGYDLMTVVFDYGINIAYWKIVYVSYSDPSLEPELVEDPPIYGEDLPDLTPDEMWNTFETASSYVVLDTAAVYPGISNAANAMDFYMGVADPAGGATNVGEYIRIGPYQELQFQMDYDIQFDNFTTVSLDVYMPSFNDYSGSLTKGITIVIAEASQTQFWWTGHIQYDATAVFLDEWVTYTFNLAEPTSGPGLGLYTPFDRDDLDFFAISLGGGGHEDPGIFYIRNFVFE